jgi:outer membrane protein OmpA-like peptidoglycan-associated protein
MPAAPEPSTRRPASAPPAVPNFAPPPLAGISPNTPAPERQQIASLPAAEAAAGRVLEGGNLYRIPFTVNSSKLAAKNGKLLDKLADRMQRDQSLRLQLLGFAAPSEDSASKSRRVSLFRALSVRTYLMKKGIRSTRMDVRALGAKSDDTTPDRVDIEVKK